MYLIFFFLTINVSEVWKYENINYTLLTQQTQLNSFYLKIAGLKQKWWVLTYFKNGKKQKKDKGKEMAWKSESENRRAILR